MVDLQNQKPLLLSVKTIAQVLDVSTRTVSRMHKEGKIRLYKIGGKLFAKYEELKADIEEATEPVLP